MGRVTTTTNGFRTEDITFKGARKQSEIENEIEKPEDEDVEVKAPVSMTPEQVKDFFKIKIATAKDSNEKRVYSQAIRWIDDLQNTRKKLIVAEEKLSQYVADRAEQEDDILS